MNSIMSYVLIPFMNWGQYFFYLIILFVAANKRFSWINNFYDSTYKFLIWLVLGFKVLYASIETFTQYYVWSSGKFTKLLLDQNIISLDIVKDSFGKMAWVFNNRFGYFLFYSWGRFWLEIVVTLIVAMAFYLFFIFLKRHKERFFEEGEVELGFLLSLLVGWPNFIVFLPLVFVSTVIVSIVKIAVFSARGGSAYGGNEMYTTLGAPFLLAALIVLLFGRYIVDILGLTAFRV